MVPPPRAGTFSPSPAQALQTGSSHSPHPSQAAALSASPVTGSPTGTTSVSKIVIAQVFVLLSSIKEEKDDPSKWEQLRKLIDESGMEVFTKYFARLVASSASQIFPGLNRPGGSPGTYQLLTAEMQKISHDPEQARRIAESIEIGTEDIFRDFDLSTFMEHFKLDALEKTILALAFKLGPRSDLKTKADAILSTNFPTFINILTKVDGDHKDLGPAFVSLLVDRFIQLHPPNFNANAKSELSAKVGMRYEQTELKTPLEVQASLDLMRVLADSPSNTLALAIQRTGSDYTRDEDTCVSYLQSRSSSQPTEEQVSTALSYTTISQTITYNPSVLAAALRRALPSSFRWNEVLEHFDQPSARVSAAQFLRLYNALIPIARDDSNLLDLQKLWGGPWKNTEAQLSFICAFVSQPPEQLDVTTISNYQGTINLDDYAQASPEVRDRAAVAAKHPLSSLAAVSAIFHAALSSQQASSSTEARRLFQTIVAPNIDIFVVSAFRVPKPWSDTAAESLSSIFAEIFYGRHNHGDFVFDSLWRSDKDWVVQRLAQIHGAQPSDLPRIFELAVHNGWLNELIYMPTIFGLDLLAFAHSRNYVDLAEWAKNRVGQSAETARVLLQFLAIKSELEAQRTNPQLASAKANIPLKISTVSALLNILEDLLPAAPIPELVMVQRQCIAVYPRLINYGEDYDDIIEANGKDGHALPLEANTRMEEHFKKMYSNEIEVRSVVEIMNRYKHSRDPLDQDVFACMINSLFEEYNHFGDYPLEALATTAVLLGGIISHKLIWDLPLKVGLGMILEAVRDQTPEQPMFKFGMQALMQMYPRFREWPGFCRQLLQCQSLRGSEAWNKAEEVVRETNDAAGGAHGSHLASGSASGEALTNGNPDASAAAEQHYPPFTSINVDPIAPGVVYEDPDGDVQDKVQFVLNNITASTLQAMFMEIKPMLEPRHQQWFASHLVEERAKMQPNYHKVYLQLVSHFEDKKLWAEVLRETFISVARMLNSEATMQNSTERTHLKNLGGWLGLLTLARDKPIRHKNIAFKQLLIEAHDTKRLIVAIPFVCKVLSSGEKSNVFRPPNPWLMDIIRFLIDLYHNAELKLNLKFEIEVLCQTLSIDHKSIEPSGEILNRVAMEEAAAEMPPDALEAYDSLALNGIVHAAMGANMPAHALSSNVVSNGAIAAIPDLSLKIHVPPVSEMVISSTRLESIVHDAITRALQDIIQPVVDRSVAIAAIATQQMIHKDFVTEPDENRIRTSAINMVKATAGNLALVTSKEPLRANFTNYMRTLSSDLPQGLPEGTIIMCVNSNLDVASSVIEHATEERAITEIEELIEPELEARRRHRLLRPNEPYVDPSLNRWAMAMPNPYKLSPSMTGLNPEQMAIYEDFAQHSRPATGAVAATAHVSSTSDATRSLANEVLQDQYSSIPQVPTPAETPSVATVNSQIQAYPLIHSATAAGSAIAGMVNGRPASNLDIKNLMDRVQKLVIELERTATEAQEQHFADLPRPHPVLDLIDALVQTIIKAQQSSEEFAFFAAEHICRVLFSSIDDSLALESAVHVLETLRKIAGPALSQRVSQYFHMQPGQTFLHIPLIAALLGTDLLDWQSIDSAMAAALKLRKDGSINFLERLLDLTLIGESPLALYTDFVNSLTEAWVWIEEEPEVPGGQQFKAKVLAPVPETTASPSQEPLTEHRKEQLVYVFDEWAHLYQNQNAPEHLQHIFVHQMQARRIVTNKDDLFVFLKIAIDSSVDRHEAVVHAGGSTKEGYGAIDSVPKLIFIFVQRFTDEEENCGGVSRRLLFIDGILGLCIIILNDHYERRGDRFNHKVFFRLFSSLLIALNKYSDQLSEADRTGTLLLYADRVNDLGPALFPFFTYSWFELVKHRLLLPALLQLPGKVGWDALTKMIRQMLLFISEKIVVPEAAAYAKDLYRGCSKLLLILFHDFPDYLAESHVELCQSIRPTLLQLINIILNARPSPITKLPDPVQTNVRLDGMEEATMAPPSRYNPEPILTEMGLASLLDQALETGPSEEVVAHVKFAICKPDQDQPSWGRVSTKTNVAVLDAVVMYIGNHAVARAQSGQAFTVDSPEAATLSMVLHELPPEGRYMFIFSIVNQLRYPNAHTTFFGMALLEIFGHGMTDPEETEIRQQITRVLFERIVSFWPQPWGLLVVIAELVKNEKFFFFDLPFLKEIPEVTTRFASLVIRP